MIEPVTVSERSGFDLASVMARRGVTAGMLGEALGFPIAEGPCVSAGGGLSMIGTGPGSWLALSEGPLPDLEGRLGALASLSEQAGAYAIFCLSGAGARTILQRGAAIDLHPLAFVPGSVATTVIAHMGVILWQVDDAPSYDVAIFRSYAGSFRHWLKVASAAL